MKHIYGNKRKYVRLKSRIPVDFKLLHIRAELAPGIDENRGSTINVGYGGICLESDDLTEATIKYFNKENLLLELKIYLPLSKKPIRAVGEVTWFKQKKDMQNHYIIGIKYRSITTIDLLKIFRHARRFKYLVWTVVILVLIFIGSIFHWI